MGQWMNEKPSGAFDTTALRLNAGDLAFGQFVANGDEGPNWFLGYRAHVFPQVGSKGGRFNAVRFCPVRSGADGECAYCQMGHTDVKERMNMWFYIFYILRAQQPTLREGQQPLPQVVYEQRYMFMQEVNGFMRWENSAWKDSPWTDIMSLNTAYHGLHNFTFQLSAHGEGINRRYKIMALPNTQGITPEKYQEAIGTLETIPDILRKDLNVPVAWSPQQQQAPTMQPMPPAMQAAPTLANVMVPAAPFQVPGAPPVSVPTAPALPTLNNTPVATAPTPTSVAAPAPPAAPPALPSAAPQTQAAPEINITQPDTITASQVQPVTEQAPVEQVQTPAVSGEQPANRPMRKMF